MASGSLPASVLPVAQLAPLLPQRGGLLGLDLGTKTIGVATSDPDRRLAAPVETITRSKFTQEAARLSVLAKERGTVAFVLGLPRNMDGSEGPRAQASRAFARNLARATGLPVALWDERLSTAAAERDLIAADASRRRRAAVIDQHAAMFILQGALDLLNRRRQDPAG
jgi:putative Holliday junction resolvase